MTDDPVTDEALDDEFEPRPPADMEAVRAALRDRLNECSVCGEGDWSIPEGPNYITAGLDANGEVNSTYGVHVATLICRSCGFVRMHHIDTLLD
jgi:hypothetical protein